MADNKKMILNLFAGVQDALFLGDRFSSGEFVSFMQPGQFISTNIQENANSEFMAIQSSIANILIDSSYVNKYQDINYSVGTELLGSVDGIYGLIMDSSALPKGTITHQDELEINELMNWLATNKPNYELYFGFLLDAQEAYDNERFSQNPSPAKLQRLLQKKKQAEKNLRIFGQSEMQELKQSRLFYLQKPDPITLFERYRQQFSDQKQTSHLTQTEYYQTFLNPPASSWNSPNTSWASFEQTISESDIHNYSKATSWSGGLSAGWGLWSFGGGVGGSTNYTHDQSEVTTVNLKFEYLRVRIVRRWMDENVFGHRFWTWNQTFGCSTKVSNGGNLAVDPPQRPIGRMPVLPNYLILVRNLEISSNFSQSDITFYQSKMNSGASFGWGPFSVSGSYREETQSKDVQASFDNITIKINQPQIIARTGTLVPLCPNPEKGLKWGSEACPVESYQPTAEELQIEYSDYKNALLKERLLEAKEQTLLMGEDHFAKMREGIERQHFSLQSKDKTNISSEDDLKEAIEE